jgi:hypothetical protein
VEQEAELDPGGVGAQPGAGAEEEPVGRDALGVLAGVGVPGLHGVRERAHRGHVGRAQLLAACALLLERLAQVARVALELALLRRRLAVAVGQLGPGGRDLGAKLLHGCGFEAHGHRS